MATYKPKRKTASGEEDVKFPISSVEGLQKKLASLQTKTDDGLNTTNKTIVGAINELEKEFSDVVIDKEISETSENAVQNKVIAEKLKTLQAKEEDGLETEEKTIPGAINELHDEIKNMTIDDALSDTSLKPVQNKVIKAAIDKKLDRLTYEWNKGINFGSSGRLYVGRFKMYDSNITLDFSCTTTETYSGKLVIATQNGKILKVNVYGDASNTLAPRLFVKGEGVGAESANRQWIQIYFNPPAWSKNIVHIFAQAIDGYDASTICTSVNAVPEDYTNIPANVLTNEFLGKSAKAADADKLGGHDSAYYLDYDNLDNVPEFKALAFKESLDRSDVGLSEVTNDAQVKRTEMGTNGGVATLDDSGKVPTSQLPSYVDDVLEYTTKGTFPSVGAAGKIYVALDTNITYRWGGSEYVEISASLALGETEQTAYAGSKGKKNAENIAALQDEMGQAQTDIETVKTDIEELETGTLSALNGKMDVVTAGSNLSPTALYQVLTDAVMGASSAYCCVKLGGYFDKALILKGRSMGQVYNVSGINLTDKTFIEYTGNPETNTIKECLESGVPILTSNDVPIEITRDDETSTDTIISNRDYFKIYGDTDVIVEGGNTLRLVAAEDINIEAGEGFAAKYKGSEIATLNDIGNGMPQIRFTKARGSQGMYFPVTFNAEIIGGGDLQVGDEFQICERQSWTRQKEFISDKRYRLKHFVSHTITQEDLDELAIAERKILSITVDATLGRGARIRRTGGAAMYEPHSFVYLRIRRKIAPTDDGNCDNAIFSNIVPIQKTVHDDSLIIR